MRINKYLAECGVGSRRKSEALILDGRVSIDGKVVTSLAVDVDPENARVLLDGKIVHPINKHIYLKMNKPKGYVCTMADDRGRKTVIDLLPEKYAGKRIFPIGRLDYDTEGLLLLTTDGDLAQALSHPSNEIPKTYIAKIEGSISEAELAKLRKGVEIDGVMTKKCKVKVLEKDEKSTRGNNDNRRQKQADKKNVRKRAEKRDILKKSVCRKYTTGRSDARNSARVASGRVGLSWKTVKNKPQHFSRGFYISCLRVFLCK